MEIEILNTPWQDDTLVTKGFSSRKKALYVEKNRPGAFEKYNQSDSHKSIVERQITLASKGYGKIPKMASKSSANKQRENPKILLNIIENVRFLGKIYSLNPQSRYLKIDTCLQILVSYDIWRQMSHYFLLLRVK